jgi:nicotinate-nucleotide--dimethylbenzimidazole phosphoribosyltransferase
MDDLTDLLSSLPEPDEGSVEAVHRRASEVLRPAGALARLDEVAAWLAGWQRTPRPRVERPSAALFVADHGVATEGISAYPAEVTGDVLAALRAGRATANAMAEAGGVRLEIVDVGVGRPSRNLIREPALSEARFRECLDAGRRTIAGLQGTDLLVLGEMGIGNTTSAAALCAVIFGGPADDWTGRGTGIDERVYARKVAVVDAARRRVEGCGAFEALRQVGGQELVAVAGAALEARRRSIPVVLDGFVVTAACAALEASRPGALAHCLAGHCSSEPGHRLLLEKLGMAPLLDLELRLGEGSGALAAVPLIRLAAAGVTDVATFDEWGLSR